MRKIFLIISIFWGLSAAVTQAEVTVDSAVILFTDTVHNFGTINGGDGKVTHIFEFVNAGVAPLVVSNVKSTCGCTVPQWTKTPIESGQTGTIEVTFDPGKRTGNFRKVITVTSNATEQITRLHIGGEIKASVSTVVETNWHKFKRKFNRWDYILGGAGICIIIAAVINMFRNRIRKRARKTKD
ncbi:MAG: DUF1573 domain-containing protein [Prevotellaceae bacterium]|jgi:hypothetical protein|nr:DUF1573 domain-containing protein [Prevotellaceae bacterium]